MWSLKTGLWPALTPTSGTASCVPGWGREMGTLSPGGTWCHDHEEPWEALNLPGCGRQRWACVHMSQPDTLSVPHRSSESLGEGLKGEYLQACEEQPQTMLPF